MKPSSLSHKILIMTVMLLVGLGVFAADVQPVHAQTPSPVTDDQVNAVASQLYSPLDPNLTLDLCSSAVCVQMRGLIRQKLAEGQTPEQIKEYFVQQYGENVLTMPAAHGINVALYILPPLIFLIAMGMTIQFILSHRQTGNRNQPGGTQSRE